MKPAMSPMARRVIVIVVGLTMAAGAAIAKMLEANPNVSLKELLIGVGMALATFAVKYPGDVTAGQVDAEVGKAIERFFPRTRPLDLEDTLPGLGPTPPVPSDA